VSSFSPRRGVTPTVLSLPAGDSPVDRIFAALAAKGAAVTRDEVAAQLLSGDIGLIDNSAAYIHRPVLDETEIDLPVIFENDRILIIDKPAGIATTPQGAYVARSVLVQARRAFGDSIICAHRLDRATRGVLLLVKEKTMRRAYHTLFSDRAVTKTYELIAPASDSVPSVYSSRIERQGMKVVEVPGPVNAVTGFQACETKGSWTRYEALPTTGQMHQIRAHAAALGIPIHGDTLYGPGDGFPHSIALLARSMSFIDPYDQQTIKAVSRQSLSFPD